MAHKERNAIYMSRKTEDVIYTMRNGYCASDAEWQVKNVPRAEINLQQWRVCPVYSLPERHTTYKTPGQQWSHKEIL
jgi:hypothetical protein